MALRLLREKLDSPSGMFDVGTLACIPPLVFFSVRYARSVSQDPGFNKGSR